jgi:hypothetical protein
MTFPRRQQTTAWNSYAPIFNTANNNGSIGNGTISGKWRRVGDSMQVLIYMAWGSTTAGGTGDLRFPYPDGFNIDPSKTAAMSVSGQSIMCYMFDDSTPANNTSGLSSNITSTTWRVVVDGNSQLSSTIPFTFATNDRIYLSAFVPILQFC